MPKRQPVPTIATAATAEVLGMYRWATQDPSRQAAVLAEIYRRARPGMQPQLLREDFAGNAADCCAWVAAGRGRRAVAVDRDAATIAYAAQRTQRMLGAKASRIEFHCADVHRIKPPAVPPADVLSVLNFSIGYFHSRAALLRYFQHARAALAENGVLIFNVFGGPGALRARIDEHPVQPQYEPGDAVVLPAFTYQWEQRSYDACRARLECRIHFDVPTAVGVRRVDSAFVYNWRLWTLPELTECLREAGFCRAQIWRHHLTQQRQNARVFLGPVRVLRGEDRWQAYVIGLK